MEENIFKKLVNIISKNLLTIRKKECFDHQSGWHGMHYYVFDGDKMITDLSGNGYCFRKSSLQTCYGEIEQYLMLKNMDTIDAFTVWCDNYAQEQERKNSGNGS